MRYWIWIIGLFAGQELLAQAVEEDYFRLPTAAVEDIRRDVHYLASPDRQGRAPGSEGIAAARRYILERFEEFGLQGPLPGNRYQQPFMIPSHVAVDSVNTGLRYDQDRFLFREKDLALGAQFYPVRYATNGAAEGRTEYVSYGIEDSSLGRDDLDDEKLRGAIAVMDIGSPDGIHPHSRFRAWHDLDKRLRLLADKGVLGVILVNQEAQAAAPEANYKTLQSSGLPVIYVADAKAAKKLRRSRPVAFSVFQRPVEIQEFNLLGYIDNQAERTVIIGAHYDHLGMGGEGSRYTGTEPAVHPGADDNASGTAGLLSLARYLPHTEDEKLRQYNYLLLAFSAEEMGLLGSKYLAERLNREVEGEFAYMLNMDMIGRLRDETIQVNGLGTSPMWSDIFALQAGELRMETSESGVGPSDHTSFYYQNMPVLHFFTGTHSDYHKPSDTPDKIEVVGIYKILNQMLNIVRASVGQEMAFRATVQESQKAPRFSVTLGIMPDYLYRQGGVKIDGVSPEKPAQAAGLQVGDIITQLGDYPVRDMQSYMEALGQFKKGQSADLLFKRKGKLETTKVKF